MGNFFNILMEIFAWPLGWVMWFFYNFMGHSYVLSLVLFTLVIRFILLPFNLKQQKNAAKMSVYQPKLQALQKKYAKDPRKLQEEQMKLYQEEGYNPMGGCAPILVQLPVLYGLFNVVYNPITHLLRISNNEVISNAVNLIRQGTGSSSPQILLMKYLHDSQVISATGLKNGVTLDSISNAIAQIPDGLKEQIKSINLNFLGLYLGDQPALASTLVIIPILSGLSALLTSFISMKLSARNTGVRANGMMRGMMFTMPIFSFVIAFSVPAGVGLYWTISNLFAAAQSYLLYKIYTPEKMAAIVEKEKEEIRQGKRKVKKGLLAKMQEAQLAQQEALNQQKAKSNAPISASQKEQNRIRIAEARKRVAEKFGEAYNENNED